MKVHARMPIAQIVCCFRHPMIHVITNEAYYYRATYQKDRNSPLMPAVFFFLELREHDVTTIHFIQIPK